MKLDLTISIGDILSAVVIVTAIIAIYFQARSVKISEEQLKANVDDVRALSVETKAVADQIKKEREIREKMSIEKMEEYTEQMNYTSHVYGEAMDFYRATESLLHEYIMSLNLGMQMLIAELKENNKVNQKSKKVISLEQTLRYMMSFIAVSQQWSDELRRHGNVKVVVGYSYPCIRKFREGSSGRKRKEKELLTDRKGGNILREKAIGSP